MNCFVFWLHAYRLKLGWKPQNVFITVFISFVVFLRFFLYILLHEMEDMICFLYKARKGKVRRRFANLVPLSLSKIWQNATIKKTLLHWIMTGCFQELIKVMCNKKVVRQANTNPFTIKSNVKLQCSSFIVVNLTDVLRFQIPLYLKYFKYWLYKVEQISDWI